MNWHWILYGAAIIISGYGIMKFANWFTALPKKLEHHARRILADYEHWSRIDDHYSGLIDIIDDHHKDSCDCFTSEPKYEYLEYELRRLDLLIYREDARHEFLMCADDGVMDHLVREYKDTWNDIATHPDRERIEAERLAECEANEIVEH